MLAGGVLVFLLLCWAQRGGHPAPGRVRGRVLHRFARLRNDPTTAVLRGIDAGHRPVGALIWWVATWLVMLIWRRWRHLFVWIGTMLLVSALGDLAAGLILRPRPLGVEILTLLAAASRCRPGRSPSSPRPLVRVALHAGPGGPLRRPRQVGRRPGWSRSLRSARLYLGVDAPDRRAGRGVASASRSRWPASGCSSPTRSSRSPTGAAAARAPGRRRRAAARRSERALARPARA